MTKLKYLSLKANQINSLDEALFEEANKLIELVLDKNDFTFLLKRLFVGLTNLENLSLDKNHISSLDKALFNETTKLTTLTLYKNDVTVFP